MQRLLSAEKEPLTIEEINRRFKGGRGRADQVENIAVTLEALGHVRRTDDGRFTA